MKNILLENLRFNNLNFFMGNYLDNFVVILKYLC